MAYASKKARNIKPSDIDKISEKPDTTIEREGGAVDEVDVGNVEELISVIVRCGSCIDVVLETSVL